MVPWREEGVVQDSDSEAGDLLSASEDDETQRHTYDIENERRLNPASSTSQTRIDEATAYTGQSAAPGSVSEQDTSEDVFRTPLGSPQLASDASATSLFPAIASENFENNDDSNDDADELQDNDVAHFISRPYTALARHAVVLQADGSQVNDPNSADSDVFDIPSSPSIGGGRRVRVKQRNPQLFTPAASASPKRLKQAEAAPVSSLESSPLSSLSSNSATSPPPPASRLHSPLSHAPPRQTLSTDYPEGPADLFSERSTVQATQNLAGHTRSLRKRNPIQVHPYQLEIERYRQTLRARGIKPINVANISGNGVESANGDDSHPLGADVNAESQSVYEGSPDSSPLSSPRQQQSQNISGLAEEASNHRARDEFQDLATSLRKSVQGEMRDGTKRRKLAHGSSELLESGAQDKPTATPSTSSQAPGKAVANTRHQVKRMKFKMPRSIAAASLPTPAQSSDPQIPSSASTNRFNNVTSDIPQRRSRVLVISDDSSSEEDTAHLRRVQRRIRGVLPASWIRLDKGPGKALSPMKQNSDQIARLHTQDENRRGVARRVTHAGGTLAGEMPDYSGLAAPFDVSSDEMSSDHETGGVTIPNRRVIESPFTFKPGLNDDEAVEEDLIDTMAAPSTRRRLSTKKRPKKQAKLTSLLGFEKVREKADNHGSMDRSEKPRSKKRHLETRPRVKHRKRTETNVKLPKLSILDVTSVDPRHGGNPNFVRVAARSARRRRDLGRQSPTKKQVSLHMREEGLVVDDTLKAWYLGKTMPSELTGMPSIHISRQDLKQRRPLQEQDGNRQVIFSRLNAIDESPDEKTSATPVSVSKSPRPWSPKMRLTPVQKKLDVLPLQITAGTDATHEHAFTAPVEEQMQPRAVIAKPNLLRQMLKSRTGQLEDEEQLSHLREPAVLFRRGLAQLNDDHLLGNMSKYRSANPLMPRYFNETAQQSEGLTTNVEGDLRLDSRAGNPQQKQRPLIRRREKRCPIRLDSSAMDVHHATTSYDPEEDVQSSSSSIARVEKGVQMRNLGTFGSNFSTDFGVHSLPLGLAFHETTFIGTGHLRQALRTGELYEDESPIIYITIEGGGSSLRLGSWTQETAQSANRILVSTESALDVVADSESRAADTDRSIAAQAARKRLELISQWLARALTFADPIDRRAFVQHMNQGMRSLSNVILDSGTQTTRFSHLRDSYLSVQSMFVVVAFQVMRIAEDAIVEDGDRTCASEAFAAYAKRLAEEVVLRGSATLCSLHEFVTIRSIAESGIRSHHPDVEAVVILNHLLSVANVPSRSFWNIMNEALHQTVPEFCVDAESYEQCWNTIFAMLPFLDIDDNGLYRKRSGDIDKGEDWSLIRRLLFQTLALCTGPSSPPNANAYVRAVLSRCYYLIRSWSWSRCESVLFSIFDFFAGNGLSLLLHEECNGSATFLEKLDDTAVLKLNGSDRSFHIFLKTLVVGLQALQRVYSAKKLKNLAWRFVPNHGRSHDKHDDLQQQDLQALRNHHDLLCVLYFAVPATARISVSLVQKLVNLESAHIELCRLNVRAWANLTKFQLSTNEGSDVIEPLLDWLNSILSQVAQQHRLARSEAEADFLQSTLLPAMTPRDMLERTISANQRQVESVLISCLNQLSSCLEFSTNIASAQRLFNGARLSEVFDLFDANVPRTYALSSEALTVYKIYYAGQKLEALPSVVQQTNTEDSQDYGENLFDDLELGDDVAEQPHTAMVVEDRAFKALQRLLSNCFGADIVSDHELLSKLTDVWAQVVAICVQTKQHDWNFFLDPHTPASWAQLRDTEQSRAYGPLFLSSVLTYDPSCLEDNSKVFLSAWMVSLMERESMLKYQHSFTMALLKVCPSHPVLQNLPFLQTQKGGYVSISLREIQERRLGLISMVLSNIRRDVEDAGCNTQQYVQILQQMMSAMRKNYQETYVGTTARGSYVDFVHRVVELLQQFTADICPIDSYFTDSASFPLPSHDPTYLIGKLRSYGVRATDIRTQKKLATFLQTACERAVSEGQTDYLIEQIVTAINNDFEDGCEEHLTLRLLLMRVFFPVYIAQACTDECSALLTRPIIQAACTCLFSVWEHINLSSTIVRDQLSAALIDMTQALTSTLSMIAHESLQAPVVATLIKILDCAASSASLFDFFLRSSHHLSPSYVNLRRSFKALYTTLKSISTSTPLEHSLTLSDPTSDPFSAARTFSTNGLLTTLRTNWTFRRDHGYSVRRGAVWKPVLISNIYLSEEEGEKEVGEEGVEVLKARLVEKACRVLRVVECLPSLHTLYSPKNLHERRLEQGREKRGRGVVFNVLV